MADFGWKNKLVHALKSVRTAKDGLAAGRLARRLEDGPGDPKILETLADLYLKLDRPGMALRCFLGAAVGCLETGDRRRGLAVYRKVRLLAPEGGSTGASTPIGTAVQSAMNNAGFHLAIGELAQWLGLSEEAGDAFLRGAAILDQRENYREALPFARRAVATDPGHRRALWTLFELSLRLGDPAVVVPFLAAAMEKDPGDEELREMFDSASSRLLEDGRRPPLARRYLLQGEAHFAESRYPEAVRALDLAILLDPAQALFYLWLGRVDLAMKSYGRAIYDFSRGLEIAPDFVGFYHLRGLAWFEQGDFEAAVDDFSRAVQREPGDGSIFFHRGQALMNQGKEEAAAADFQTAARLKPELSASSYFNFALCRMRLQDYAAAVGGFILAMTFDAALAAEALYYSGQCRRESLDFAGAEQDLRQALETGLPPDLAAEASSALASFSPTAGVGLAGRMIPDHAIRLNLARDRRTRPQKRDRFFRPMSEWASLGRSERWGDPRHGSPSPTGSMIGVNLLRNRLRLPSLSKRRGLRLYYV